MGRGSAVATGHPARHSMHFEPGIAAPQPWQFPGVSSAPSAWIRAASVRGSSLQLVLCSANFPRRRGARLLQPLQRLEITFSDLVVASRFDKLRLQGENLFLTAAVLK